MKVFIKKAMEWGAKLVPSKGKHLKFRDSLGHQISAPKTSSDWRSIKNFESELRRKGFVNQNTATKVKDALPSTTTKPKVKEIKLSSQQRRLGASANRKAGGLSLQNFMRKVDGKDLIQPTPTSRTTIKSLPASKLGKPAPKVPTLTQRKLKPSTPRTGSNSSERMSKAFDDKLDALIQSVRNSPRRRVNRLEKSSTTTSTSRRTTPKGERKKISRAELDGMNIPQKQKDELIKQGLVTENKFRAAAQLMNKIGIRKPSDLTRTVNTIKQQVGDKIIQSLRTPKQPTKKGLELQGRMSRAVDKNKDKYPGLFEDNKHREDKLNYQYKDVTNPKKPVDVIKALKLKKA